jgi:hypothetical protein
LTQDRQPTNWPPTAGAATERLTGELTVPHVTTHTDRTAAADDYRTTGRDLAAKLDGPLYLELRRKGEAARNVGFIDPADQLADAIDRCEEPERWDGMS